MLSKRHVGSSSGDVGHVFLCCREEVKEKERLPGPSWRIEPGVHKEHKSEIAELLTKVCHLFFKLVPEE